MREETIRKIEQLRELVGQGILGTDDLARMLHTTREKIIDLSNLGEIALPARKETNIVKAIRLLERGITISEVRIILNQTPKSFYGSYMKHFPKKYLEDTSELDSIQIHHIRKRARIKGNPKINALIDEGLNGAEIGRAVGCTRRSIDYYIQGSGQHAYWIKRVNARKETEKRKKESLERFKIGVIYIAIANRILGIKDENERWAEEKALEYRLGQKCAQGRRIDFDNLVELARAYKTALDKGERPSYIKLIKYSGIPSKNSITAVLQGMHLKPFNGKALIPFKHK